MHILHLEGGRHLYGGALQVLYLMEALAAAGHRNTLACPAGSEIAAACRGASLVTLPIGGEIDLRLAWRLARLIRRTQPDILHVHSRRGVDWWGAIAARLAGVPAVVTRRVDNPERVLVARLKYRLYRQTIAISPAIAEVLRAAGVPAGRVALVPSAVDTRRFTPGGDRHWFRREFGLGPQERTVGMVAQFIARKGHRDLLRAIPRILSRHPGTRFLLLGRGPLQPEIERRCQEAGIAGRVLFAGFRQDLERILPCLDLLVHPAGMEGLGVSLLQASAAGVPIVAYRAGGIPSAVQDGISGLLVAPGDVEGLAAAVLALLGDANLSIRMGLAGRRKACSTFSIEAMVRGNLAVYRQIMRGEGGS